LFIASSPSSFFFSFILSVPLSSFLFIPIFISHSFHLFILSPFPFTFHPFHYLFSPMSISLFPTVFISHFLHSSVLSTFLSPFLHFPSLTYIHLLTSKTCPYRRITLERKKLVCYAA
jgi:hypothetical protein